MHIDTTVDAAIQTADLVVEAVVENMELKQKLFAEYDDKVITDHCSLIKQIDLLASSSVNDSCTICFQAPAKTILASNTSSLPISEIASSTLRLDRSQLLQLFHNPHPHSFLSLLSPRMASRHYLHFLRFGGLHFFNPVPVMKLLEVVRIPETSDETFNAMVAWGKV